MGDVDPDPDHAESPSSESESLALQRISPEKASRFYDRIRSRIRHLVDNKGHALGTAAELLLFVPDVFILLVRLIGDPRVSRQKKTLIGTGLAYFLLPIDFVPEALVGPIGFLDDLVFAVYILDAVLVDTDESVLREHWSGSEDVLVMMRKVLSSAESLVSRGLLDRFRSMIGGHAAGPSEDGREGGNDTPHRSS